MTNRGGGDFTNLKDEGADRSWKGGIILAIEGELVGSISFRSAETQPASVFPDHAQAYLVVTRYLLETWTLNHTNLQWMICKSSSALVSTVMVANRGGGFDQARLDYGVDRCWQNLRGGIWTIWKELLGK